MSDTPHADAWSAKIKAARKAPVSPVKANVMARRRALLKARRRRAEAVARRAAFLEAVRGARRADAMERRAAKPSRPPGPRLPPAATRFRPASSYPTQESTF